MEHNFSDTDKKAIADLYYATVPVGEAMTFLEKNYNLVEEIKLPRTSTDHEYFLFYKNPKTDDVRMLKKVNGCFCTFYEMWTVELLTHETDKFKGVLDKYPDSKINQMRYKSHQMLIDKYDSLVNPLVIDNPPGVPKLKM